MPNNTELDEIGHAHEAKAQEFLTRIRTIMVDALQLSEICNPEIFARVNGLHRALRDLLRDNSEIEHERTKRRIEAKVSDAIRNAY